MAIKMQKMHCSLVWLSFEDYATYVDYAFSSFQVYAAYVVQFGSLVLVPIRIKLHYIFMWSMQLIQFFQNHTCLPINSIKEGQTNSLSF